MKPVVIKLFGGGCILESDISHKVPWLQYRKFTIDHETIKATAEAISEASKERKVLIVPGGIGSFLYTNLASALQLNGHIKRRIGCSIVNTLGELTAELLHTLGVNVSPSLMPVSETLASHLDKYDAIVVEAEDRFVSTDSLAAAAAGVVGAELLVLQKKGVPRFYIGFKEPTVVNAFRFPELRKLASSKDLRINEHPVIDLQALDFIEESEIDVVLHSADDTANLKSVMCGQFCGTSTKIVRSKTH